MYSDATDAVIHTMLLMLANTSNVDVTGKNADDVPQPGARCKERARNVAQRRLIASPQKATQQIYCRADSCSRQVEGKDGSHAEATVHGLLEKLQRSGFPSSHRALEERLQRTFVFSRPTSNRVSV